MWNARKKCLGILITSLKGYWKTSVRIKKNLDELTRDQITLQRCQVKSCLPSVSSSRVMKSLLLLVELGLLMQTVPLSFCYLNVFIIIRNNEAYTSKGTFVACSVTLKSVGPLNSLTSYKKILKEMLWTLQKSIRLRSELILQVFYCPAEVWWVGRIKVSPPWWNFSEPSEGRERVSTSSPLPPKTTAPKLGMCGSLLSKTKVFHLFLCITRQVGLK